MPPLPPNLPFPLTFKDTTTWDEDMLHGCVCDSAWTVGLGSGQTQEPEWFGPDCSLRKFLHSLFFLFFTFLLVSTFSLFQRYAGHCLSHDDPRTIEIETNCQNVTATGSLYAGSTGNLCQIDCSNRGICDYTTGLCNCFDGQYGADCSIIDATAMYSAWKYDYHG